MRPECCSQVSLSHRGATAQCAQWLRSPLQHTPVHCTLSLTFSALDSAGFWTPSFFWTPFWNPFLSPFQRQRLCPPHRLHLAVTHQVILPWVGLGEWLKCGGQGRQQKRKKREESMKNIKIKQKEIKLKGNNWNHITIGKEKNEWATESQNQKRN